MNSGISSGISSGMSSGRLAYLAAALTGIQVGAATFATHFVFVQSGDLLGDFSGNQTGPITLGFFRYLVAILFLLPFTVKRLGEVKKSDLLPISLLGIGQFGILIILLNYAVQYIDPGRATLIFALFPILALIIGATFGRDIFTFRKLTGIVLTVVGIGYSLGYDFQWEATTPEQWIGMASAFASALIGAICSVAYRPYLERNPTLPVCLLAMLAAVLFLGVTASLEGLYSNGPGYSFTGWQMVLFIGASSGVGYVLWLYALKYAMPSNVSAFLGLSPPTAILLSVIFLSQAWSLGHAVGFALILFGLYVALWQKRKIPGLSPDLSTKPGE